MALAFLSEVIKDDDYMRQTWWVCEPAASPSSAPWFARRSAPAGPGAATPLAHFYLLALNRLWARARAR